MVKIIFTGYPSMNNAVEAVNKHADAFMIKPANFEALLQRVKELLKEQQEATKYSEETVAKFIETRTMEILDTKTNNKAVAT